MVRMVWISHTTTLLLFALSGVVECVQNCDYNLGDALPTQVFRLVMGFQLTMDKPADMNIRQSFAEALEFSIYRVRIDPVANEPLSRRLRLMSDICHVDVGGPNSTVQAKEIHLYEWTSNATAYEASPLYKAGFTTFDIAFGLKQGQGSSAATETVCQQNYVDVNGVRQLDIKILPKCPIGPTPAPDEAQDPNIQRKAIGVSLIGVVLFTCVSGFWAWWQFFENRQIKIAVKQREEYAKEKAGKAERKSRRDERKSVRASEKKKKAKNDVDAIEEEKKMEPATPKSKSKKPEEKDKEAATPRSKSKKDKRKDKDNTDSVAAAEAEPSKPSEPSEPSETGNVAAEI